MTMTDDQITQPEVRMGQQVQADLAFAALSEMLSDLENETYPDTSILGVTIPGDLRREAERVTLTALALRTQIEALVARRDALVAATGRLAEAVRGQVEPMVVETTPDLLDGLSTVIGEVTGSRRAWSALDRMAEAITE